MSQTFSRDAAHNRSDLEESKAIPLYLPDSGGRARSDRFQVFIRLPSGNLILEGVNVHDSVEALRDGLERREGFPRNSFYLIHEGKLMQDTSRIS